MAGVYNIQLTSDFKASQAKEWTEETAVLNRKKAEETVQEEMQRANETTEEEKKKVEVVLHNVEQKHRDVLQKERHCSAMQFASSKSILQFHNILFLFFGSPDKPPFTHEAKRKLTKEMN